MRSRQPLAACICTDTRSSPCVYSQIRGPCFWKICPDSFPPFPSQARGPHLYHFSRHCSAHLPYPPNCGGLEGSTRLVGREPLRTPPEMQYFSWAKHMVCSLLPECSPLPLPFHGPSPGQVGRKKRGMDHGVLTRLTLEQISWRLVAMAFAGVSHRNT